MNIYQHPLILSGPGLRAQHRLTSQLLGAGGQGGRYLYFAFKKQRCKALKKLAPDHPDMK